MSQNAPRLLDDEGQPDPSPPRPIAATAALGGAEGIARADEPAARPRRPPAPIPLEQPLGTWGLLKALWRNPLEAWTRDHFEQPVVVHDYRLGRVAVVSEPTAIRRVLLDNSANYRKDNLQRRVLGRPLHKGLLMVEGDDWRQQRRTLAPLFNARAIADFAPAMRRVAEDLASRWRAADGAIVDVAAEMAGVALDVLVRTIFPDGLGGDIEDWRAAMRDYFDNAGRIHPFDALGLPEAVPRLRLRSGADVFSDRVERLIAAHAKLERRDKPRDLLTLLIESRDPSAGASLGEAEIKANILTFIAAGHETTANAVTWSLYLLSLSPEWRAEVAAEAQQAWQGPSEQLTERLVKTRAVVDEALRLYPPLAAISRVAVGPDRLADADVGAGTMVVVAPYVLHRHRRLWDDPDLFDPSRLLPSAAKPIDRYAYLPFGAGPRVCIGAAFAIQEALIVVSAVAANFDFEVAPGHDVWPLQRVTLRPRNGLPMRIRRRK